MANILIVEDDEVTQELIEIFLTNVFPEHNYQKASDGLEAKEYFEEEPYPDILITDIIMPNMEGTELIIDLRKKHPNLKIIAISGGGINEPGNYLKVAKFLGADHVLKKPLDLKELKNIVSSLL